MAVPLIRNAGKARIRVSMFLEKIEPALYRELRDDDGGPSAVSSVYHFKKIPSFVQVEL